MHDRRMIVVNVLYEKGSAVAEGLPLHEAAKACRSQEDSFVWIGLHEPTLEEFEAVQKEFSLHELAVEDALDPEQRPKLEMYDDMMFLVLRTAKYDDANEVVDIGSLMIFVSEHFVLTVRYGSGTRLSGLRKRLSSQELHQPGSIVYHVLDRVVDDYENVLNGIEYDIEQVEEQVFSDEKENPVERIYRLGRQVLALQRAVSPLTGVVSRLGRNEYFDEELEEYMRDVHDHLLRASTRINDYKGLLDNALQANLTQVSVRQNEDMRKISAWVAILAVPTMVAGLYGMNFEKMPGLSWQYGYPATLLFTAVACTLLYRRFRRIGWL